MSLTRSALYLLAICDLSHSACAQAARWVADYGYDASAGGWRVENHIRLMADVNRDGKADVVGFGGPGVYVSLSTGTSFTAPSLWVAGFGSDAADDTEGFHCPGSKDKGIVTRLRRTI